MIAPNALRDGALEIGSDDEIRPEQLHGLDGHRIADIEFDRDLVPPPGQLDEQPLGQAIEGVGEEQNAHQHILGNCSPASQSTMRPPPNAVRICTKWCGSSMTSPMTAA